MLTQDLKKNSYKDSTVLAKQELEQRIPVLIVWHSMTHSHLVPELGAISRNPQDI